MTTIILRGKSITCSSDDIIRQYESNIEQIKCLIPKNLNGVDMTNCNISLFFKDEFGNGGCIIMDKNTEDYNKDYFLFCNYINSNLTQYTGKITIWLNVAIAENDVSFTTSVGYINIVPSEASPTDLTQTNSNYFDQCLIKMNQIKNHTLKIQNEVINLSNKMRTELSNLSNLSEEVR